MKVKTQLYRDVDGDHADPYPKVVKPVIERRRRARMNENIHQIRMLTQTSLGDEVLAQGRLERAEILEMTVKHIQQQPARKSNGPAMAKESYGAGYTACLNEILSCLEEGEHSELRAKICGFAADMLERRLNAENNPPVLQVSTHAQVHPGHFPAHAPYGLYMFGSLPHPELPVDRSRSDSRPVCRNISNIINRDHRPVVLQQSHLPAQHIPLYQGYTHLPPITNIHRNLSR